MHLKQKSLSFKRTIQNMRLKFLFLTLALSLAYQAQAADSQNLMQIYQQALSHDPVWMSAQSSNRALQEKLVQGQSQFLPAVTLNGGASVSKTEFSPVGATVFSNNKSTFAGYTYDLNVTQPLFHKQYWAQLNQAKNKVAQADQQLAMAHQGLILRTAKAYFDVLLAQDKVELIEAQKKATLHQLAQAKANFDVGTSTITDFNEAKARFDLIEAQEIAAKSDVEVKKHGINAIIGQLPSQLNAVRDDLQTQLPDPFDIEKWVDVAEQNSLTIAIQQQALEIATQEIEAQNSGHFPTLDVVGDYKGGYSNGGINGYGTDLQNTTIGIQLQIPVYQGGYVSSKVREAVANKQKALDDIEVAKRQVDLDTRSAYLNLASSVAQIKAYEQALNSSQSQLDSTNLGYEVGVRTSVDVLNAQQQYYSAKRDLLQSRYTYLVNILSLKSAVGLLSEADLEGVNQQLVSR
jgi:outer membrane protein